MRYSMDERVKKVIPAFFRGRICLSCYDKYAQEAGVNWKVGRLSFRPAKEGVHCEPEFSG